MKKQIKKIGQGAVISLTKEEMMLHGFNIGDMLDVELTKTLPTKTQGANSASETPGESSQSTIKKEVS